MILLPARRKESYLNLHLVAVRGKGVSGGRWILGRRAGIGTDAERWVGMDCKIGIVGESTFIRLAILLAMVMIYNRRVGL